MNQKQERRSNYPMPEKEMYELSDLDKFIKEEKRHDELSRLHQVKQQKKVWLTVISLSAFVNLIFLLVAILGE